MKIGKISIALAIALASMTACSNKQDMATTLSPQTTTIDGNMGEYYEIVEGDYKVSDFSSEFKFDVKCIKDTPYDTYTKLGIGYEILDESGKVLDSKNATLEYLNPLDSYQFLNLKEGEEGQIKIYIAGYPDALKGAKTFKITINAGGEVSEVTPAEEEVSEPATAASNNWDKVLDEYEDYCNKVSSLSKKAMAGDMSAMTEYASLVENAESLSNKLENAEDEMTTAQVARLNKIAQKMAQSMM